MADMLSFRRVTGEYEEIAARVDDAEYPAGEFLMARTVWLQDGTPPDGHELRQHRPVSGDRRRDGYARLDNEILAGRRLHQMADWGGYPGELVRLHGDESISADPYALFEPYRGEPLREVGANLFDDEFDKFLSGLLTGLCWLASVGIAHRAIGPDTVRWDSDSVQITDFSRSAPFGAVRTPLAGSSAWIARESRPDTCYGTVGPTDDVWAAARLIYFVRSRGENLEDPGKLVESGLAAMFNGLLGAVFGPPERRPTASDLIQYGLRRPHLLPSLADASKPLISGRASFLKHARERKHPGAQVPAEFWDDINWMRSRWGTPGTSGTAGTSGTSGTGDGAG
jgi:serine/threonine protein kinase